MAKVDLANLDNLRRWNRLLDKAAELYAQNYFAPNQFESEFVKKMIDNTATRKGDGIPWNPTLKQYNYLHTLVHGA